MFTHLARPGTQSNTFAALLLACFLQLLVAPQLLSAARGIAVPASLAVRKELSPPARGVAELRFRDIYQNPVGPLGLELSERARTLDGKRVRMVGFMVAEEHATPGGFMFAPLPAAVGHDDEALADDLPPSTVFVRLESAPEATVPHLPGLLALHGTLSVGARSEPAFGRISSVRLLLDKRTTGTLLKLNRRLVVKSGHGH